MQIMMKQVIAWAIALLFCQSFSFAQMQMYGGGSNMPVKLAEPSMPGYKNILLVSVGHTNQLRTKLLQQAAAKNQLGFATQSSYGLSDQHWLQLFNRFDLIMLEGMDANQSQKSFAGLIKLYKNANVQQHKVKIISVREAAQSPIQKGLTEQQAQYISGYYLNGGNVNFNNMMVFIADNVLANKQINVSAPVVLPPIGFYHPDYSGQISDNADAFRRWLKVKANQPVIVITMHRAAIELEDSSVIDQLITALESRGAKALGFYHSDVDKVQDYVDLLQAGGKSWADLIINYRVIHYADKRQQEFSELNVPVIQAINYYDGAKEDFIKDHAGVSATMTPFFLVMPESSGVVDPVILAAKTDGGGKLAIQEQLQALADRAVNHARLKYIAKADKKLALMMWNYPPGEKNIGAAFLNVPQSLIQISAALSNAGYQITAEDEQWYIDNADKLLRPFYRAEDASPLIGQGLADYLPLSTYQRWFNALPKTVKQPIIERWGLPADNPMLVDHQGERAFVIPRMRSGNLIMLPQPGRGDGQEDQAALYHSMITPINHFYLAAYLYLKEVWSADAIIHLGTHGSQEWLPGKERGLWAYDASNLAVGNVPVVYPYIIDNVGEAMQAKRRGRATMISHLTPGFAEAGAYRELAELQELLANYMQLDEGGVRETTRDKAIALAEQHNMLSDLNLSAEQTRQDFDRLVPELQDYIQALASQSQPLGLHTFGTVPADAHLYTTISQMLGDDFKQQAKRVEDNRNWTVTGAERIDENGAVRLQALAGYQTLKRYLEQGIVADKALQPALEQAKNYWQNFQATEELPNLIRALDGEFIRPCHGNDPIRNPDAAPTGCNLIGFDPARVPSKAAWEVGSELAEQTIADHYQRHGQYPDKLAFSLWSLETMRHHGVLEAQILRTMGVRPKWAPGGQVIGTEIIPYAELKRPRVDIAVTATGLYRDAFANVMLWLAKAIDDVAKLKEDNNSLYTNSQKTRQALLEQGVSAEDADYFSTVRIFSNESGNYGTGLADSSLASDSWETDSKLADLYMRRMGYWFGKDAKRWSEKVEGVDLYRQVLSGTDGVVFSRSSNLYALLTNDDPFQYFGGIGLAVRNIDGATPEMFVSNLRKAGSEKMETMERFLAKELRARYFHPRWIEQMQNEGYAGATAILDRMNNFWGWEVMAPEYVHDQQWQQFFEVYVEDSYDMQINEWFEQVNPTAQAQMLERMIEAVRKDYWAADEETLKRMTERYIELANQYDVFTQNTAFTEYVNTNAAGFGLDMSLPVIDALPMPAAPSQPVQGQKLEKVTATSETSLDNQIYWLVFSGFLLFLLGAWRQANWALPRFA